MHIHIRIYLFINETESYTLSHKIEIKGKNSPKFSMPLL